MIDSLENAQIVSWVENARSSTVKAVRDHPGQEFHFLVDDLGDEVWKIREDDLLALQNDEPTGIRDLVVVKEFDDETAVGS